ncbi:MAG: hypothetical protein ACC682_07980 [Gemmatimonadota bacterium]
MNWQAAGAIGEILGAAGVIVTLGYLSLQIRASTRATRIETADRVLARVNASQARLIESAELTAIVRRGAHDMESLESDERVRVKLLFFEMLKNSEQATLVARQGALDREMFERWYRGLCGLLDSWPALTTYLRENKELFDDAFVDLCLRRDEADVPAAPVVESDEKSAEEVRPAPPN